MPAPLTLQPDVFIMKGKLRQHRTIASAGFDGPFPSQIRCEKFEIHKVFLHFRNKFVMQNSSPNLLAELCGIAIKQKNGNLTSLSGCRLRYALFAVFKYPKPQLVEFPVSVGVRKI